jgi:hypothetical protein
MTRRDFQALATAIYEAKIPPVEKRKLANIIVSVCLCNSKTFDIKKFYEAAGLNELYIRKEKA